MSARTPAEVYTLFTRFFSAGDLDSLVLLYEANAVLIPQPGQKVVGTAGIKEALAAFLTSNGRFRMGPPKVTQAADIAVMVAEWSLEVIDADGHRNDLAGQTCDTVRRQLDGRWLFVLDSPFGVGAIGV